MSSTATEAGRSTRSETASRTASPRNSETTPTHGWQLPRTGTIVVLFVVAALVLRLWELGDRPLHHDESLDAWWSWLFRNGRYEHYDPIYHGPLRFYITAGFYELFGESEAVARLFSALCGTAVVGLPWFLRRELGRSGTIAASAALCISPTMLYYSRFGREDAQMVFLTLLAMVLGLSFLRRPRTATATGLLFVLACSFAIKESTYLFVLLLVIYVLVMLAAQFDAQNRADLGMAADDRDLNAAFTSSALLLAAAGLLIAVVIGNAGDELFTLIAVYGAMVAALVFVTALPRLRQAGISWTRSDALLCIVGAGVAAGVLLWMRSQAGDDPIDGATTPPGVATAVPWNVSIIAIVFGALVVVGAAVVLLARELSLDLRPALLGPRARIAAGSSVIAGLAVLANEYAERESNRLIVVVIAFALAWGLAAMIAHLPRTSSGFTWPPLLRSFGAIGLFGWAVALGTFAVSWFLFFTIWGTVKGDWASGFTEAIAYWDSQQEVNRGGQPWYYYLYVMPAYEWLFVGLAFVGGWRALRRPTMFSVLFVWFAIGSLILYSYAGERMPWLVAHPLLPLLVLAAMGVELLWANRSHRAMPAIASVLALGLLATTATSLRASFPNGADSREMLSQAGQATPHLTAALERLDNIDRIKRQQTGEGATLAIGTENAWPYSWYLRDRDGVAWFDAETGPPTDGSADVIIADYAAVDLTQFVDYQPTLFAMRSWWVPTYTDAGPLGWLGWAKGLDLWEQGPNPNFTGVSEVEPSTPEGGIVARLDRIRTGAHASSRSFISVTGAADDVLAPPVDPNLYVEPDDGRDGCGSVDQWFLVRNTLAPIEAEVYPGPIARMGPLACASDLLATS